MPTILVASDSREVREQVQVALVRPGFAVVQAERGQDVGPYVASTPPDLVILDMQIANMGGIATALDLRLEESAGRAPHVPILLLLDRQADRFLARRAEVDGYLVKPVDAGTLRRTVRDMLEALPEPDEPEARAEGGGERAEAAASTETPSGAPDEPEHATRA